MENINFDNKEAQVEPLTPLEKESLVDIVTQEEYGGTQLV